MPSLLSRAALAALAGSGGHPRRRLVQDASLTPCTHDICGRRLTPLPTYHADSLVPGTNLKRCDAEGQATTCLNEATGFATDNYLMKLDISQAHRGGGGRGTITRSGNDIVVEVTMGSGWNQYDKCILGVDIAQDKPNSDATLQFSANTYVSGDTLTADYSGNTTLAVPAETTDVTSSTMSVTVNPSSFPYRYEDNNGAKLHTGRLGITLSPYIRCDGSTANEKQFVAVYLPDFHAQAKATDGITAHPFFYDLKADGASLTSQDKADPTSGDLDGSGINAKRAFKYSAPFVHFHDQVRFPNVSIAGKSHDDHFESPDDPGEAKCSWNHGAFVDDINYDGDAPTLRDNGWMSDKDSATPTQAYSAWAADECAAGVCKKYRKDATVASDTAYLPFDKPLVSYYDTLPKVECVSQHGTVEGIAKSSEIVPDIASDNAPAIFSGVKTKFTAPVNIACADSSDGSVNNVDTTICDTYADSLIIKGQMFSFSAVTTDFTNLLTDEYDFSATYSCDKEQVAGTPAETCTITNGQDTAVIKLTALKRMDDQSVNLKDQLEAKADAVEALTFDVPAKYGTTFKTFKLTLSSYGTVTSEHNYRATGAFEVTMLLSDSDQTTVGEESIQWTGGPAAKDTKDFEGFETDRFTARTPLIKTQTRVKASAIAGYFTADADFSDNGDGTGIMSPFNDVGDLALSDDATEKDNLEGTTDVLTLEMGPGNQFYAVKSYCCGRDDTRNGVDCQKSRAGGDDAAAGLAAADAAASVYCRTNGFEAVRCLSSELDVEYTVTTLSKDARFPARTVVATKTYTEGATASLPRDQQGFSVTNTEYDAVTVGAGERAGDPTFDYTVSTTHMGTAKTQFARQAYTTASDDETYNCESVGRTIVYSVDIATPCGESELDTPTMSKYALTADLEAHYVYTDGEGVTPDQVSQKVATGTIGNKDNGAEAYDNPDNADTDKDWLTTEWRVQDSSDPSSAAKGSGTPIELKVIIANDFPAGADVQAQGLHMPSSKVFIVNDDTLNVTSGPGSVELKNNSCATVGGETSCVLLYTNDEVMSIDDGKLCGDLGNDNAVGGTNGNTDQPACPVIEYTIAARVKNGGVTNAFGADGACGVEAGEVALTKIGGVRTHTLYVMGNKRAYDGVLDIHAIERDTQCADYCLAAGEAANCYEESYTSSNSEFLKPEVSDGSTYCRNPFRLATETLHDVAVPGKDGAARTNLDRVTEGEVSTSKDLTFEVRFLRIGYGPRRFTIDGLTENVPASLPKPFICSSGEYANADGEGCVRSDRTADLGNVDTVIQDQKICPGGGTVANLDCTEAELIDNVGKFYIALGKDKTADLCSNANVGDDPYTVDVGGVPTMTLGFSIKVEYFTEEGVGTGYGPPDTGVPHNFFFKLACPQKDYSMNLVYADGDANALRANIPADTNMGLISKEVYGESHYKYLKMFSYFSGRSAVTYESDNVQHKAMVRLLANPSVKFRDTGAQPVSTFNGQGAIFLDTADTFESRQTIEFEFENTATPCLFTTITLISKASPFTPGTTTLITNDAEDKSFSFRVQCPRWSDETASDALVLHYDVKATDFGGSGGSVTTEIQALTTIGQVNPFDSITTSLRGCLCDSCPEATPPPATACLFPTTDTDGNALAAGADSKLEKTESQQEWLEYLQSCGFVATGGNFVGYMERQYSRPDLGLTSGQQEYQTYCSGRKLSFGIQTQGTHTARLRVESPLQMDFAVQIDKLEWSQVGCDANQNQYKLVAEATVYRKVSSVVAWNPAASSTFTDIVATSGFISTDAGTVVITEHQPQAGSMKIEGVCQGLAADHSNCGVFEAERQLDFGALYSKFGVDYRANLGIDLTMTCPKGEKQGSDTGEVALRHSTECADYDDPNDAFATCQNTETDGAGETVVIVGANGQVRLTLIIDDTAYTSHTVSPPTYKITPTNGGAATTGLVTSLCSVDETDCMYRAKDANGDYIDLVTPREYPEDLVPIKGDWYNFSSRADEENSVVTLRALPLSDNSVEITWVVNRVVDGRRLRVTYSLGAAATNGADSVGFRVLPATREEDAGIAVGAETEEVAEEAHATEQSGTSHAEEEKEEDSSMLVTLLTVAGVIAAAALGIVVVMRRVSQKKKGSSESSSGDPGFMKSRFYQYARLDKGQDDHVENLWKRNRFNTESTSRFL